jgi:hypothetical protein
MSIRNESEVLRFKGAAETYCKLLEGQPADIDSWVEHILAALANVYASAQQLPEQDIQDNAPDIYELFEVTPEERKAVYGLVQDLLGWQCGYWSYFDPSEPPSSDDEAVRFSLGRACCVCHAGVASNCVPEGSTTIT